MKMIIQIGITAVILIFLSINSMAQQGVDYKGPEDGAGDPHLEYEAFMRGNRVQVLFKNNTELGDYRFDAARWPRGPRSVRMHDGIGLLIGTKVYLENDTIPVTDINEIKTKLAQGLLDSLFYIQTNYREEMDRNKVGDVEWGFHPAPGYMNPAAESPALSDNPNSWPQAGWPFDGRELHWPGEWDGRFGRGQTRADLECYFVANDAQDLEYITDETDRPHKERKYFPRPGLRIGDIDPNVTVQKGEAWGGLGVRVKQRGFQWNNPMAQDAIFWEYTIANVSDYDYPYVSFGYWMDNNIGGENTGDDGFFDKLTNLSYSWDVDNRSTEGYPTGTFGLAFLESPGISSDGIDNDDDGIIDEQRNNTAGEFVAASIGIANAEQFKAFYGVDSLKAHWEGDEDQDWVDGTEVNPEQGYQVADGDFPGDDVGLDGVAPGEENWNGPDADGTEGNHKPDISPQGYAEPNFGWTDVSETDMLGLTTLLFYNAPDHGGDYDGWFRNDKSVWNKMIADSLEPGKTDVNNLFELFASGRFPLNEKKTAFISLSELHSYDDLAGLNSEDRSAPALFELKKTVQLIYEKDYRFAQPPLTPNLTAIPGDGYVRLIWDDRSDKLTREPFLPAGAIENNNDFEGYKIYRSTDKDFVDPQIITDGYGTKTLKSAIFQCDKKNGRKGFTDYGLLNGMAYYLGDDTGLTHTFVDNTVQNGRTYYYAVVAYDFGIPPEMLKGTSLVTQAGSYGITPAENSVVVSQNEWEEINFSGPNVAIVTPGTNASDVVDESVSNVNYNNASGNGSIIPEVVAPKLVKNGHQYKIKFRSKNAFKFTLQFVGDRYQKVNNGFEVYDITDNNRLAFSDILVKDENGKSKPEKLHSVLQFNDNGTISAGDDFYHLPFAEYKTTDIFDGIQLKIKMDYVSSAIDYENTGWTEGVTAPVRVMVTELAEKYNPWKYNIIFSDTVVYTGRSKRYSSGMRDYSLITIPKTELLYQQDFKFKALDMFNYDLGLADEPEELDLVVHDVNANGTYEILEDKVLVGRLEKVGRNLLWEYTLFTIDFPDVTDESQLPQNNDLYQIRFKRCFHESDSVTFTVNSEQIVQDQEAVKKSMDEIKVVPNPYIATNVMESSVLNKFRNQRRRLLFTHLPETCTIKIFTVSGVLIRELHTPDDGLTDYNGFGDTSNGILHWDMLTKEGLEIAAGMYFYHVQDDRTGEKRLVSLVSLNNLKGNMMINKKIILIIGIFLLIYQGNIFAQKPYRVGTTTAAFLEIGVGGSGIAMGDAYVASVNDVSGIHWNPAGLALLQRNEACFMYQPWVVDANSYFAGIGLVIPRVGNVGIGISGLNYGETEVTTMDYQEGTGETFSAQDYAFSLTYSRSLAQWFSFGSTVKYISSQIWHSRASAFAFDLGVLVQTPFFSATGHDEDGLKIGMCISNYGTRMKYDGYDLLFPYDQEEDVVGSYERVEGKYKMEGWELPLLFRVGVAFNPIVISNHKITLGIDALHPNNMSEQVNVGAQYSLNIPGFGDFYLRGGYKAMFMDDSEYGESFGGGVKWWLSPAQCFKIDYAFHSIGILGNVNCFSFGIIF